MPGKAAPREAEAHAAEAGRLIALGQNEAALVEAESALALDPDHVLALLNRGLACKALRRWADAAAAFESVLAAFPDFAVVHVHLAGMYAELGRIAEAEKQLHEAIALEPSNAAAHANLGAIYMRIDRHDLAEAPLRAALALDPAIVAAHQNLAALLAATRPAEARSHRDAAYRAQQIFVQPASVSGAPTVLVLTAANDGNVPYLHLLPSDRYARVLWYVEYAPPGQETQLPAYDIVFNAVGDLDASLPAQQAALRFAADCAKPLLNRPDRIARTYRSSMPGLIGHIASLVVPAVARLEPDGRSLRDAVTASGIPFPLIVRRAGTHGGATVRLMVTPDALANAPFDDVIYAIQFVDNRSADGRYRKYRAIFVDRVPYPYHLAISDDWLVHYWTAHMGRDPAKRAEEAAFLENPTQAIGARGMAALSAIGAALDLDYAGIDFGVLPDGRLLFYEANATMLVHPESNAVFAYKAPAVTAIVDAVAELVKRRLAPHG